MTDSGIPQNDGKRSLSQRERQPLLSNPSPPSARRASALQNLQKGTGMSRIMKIIAIAAMLLCVLAIIRMWINRENAVTNRLTAPAGVQVAVRSSPLDNVPVTTANLPELEKRFRTPVSQFLSQQEILHGIPASDIRQQLSASSRLVTGNGQSIALFHWQATAPNHADQVFMILAYGNRDGQTHRVLCLDRKPVNTTDGRCGNAIASVFHLKVPDTVH